MTRNALFREATPRSIARPKVAHAAPRTQGTAQEAQEARRLIALLETDAKAKTARS